MDQIPVYLEISSKRVFAGAVEWPGWCRAGRDEQFALQVLVEYAPRYAREVAEAHLDFTVPASVSGLRVVERLEGGKTTDFGAPEKTPSADERSVDDEALARLQDQLAACWSALERAAREAKGKELSKGPRGGGRELDGMLGHVLDAQSGYLSQLGARWKRDESLALLDTIPQARAAVEEALSSAVHGDLPKQGPRGGKRWTPRYFVRRSAWHILDHAWEIEDRMVL